MLMQMHDEWKLISFPLPVI